MTLEEFDAASFRKGDAVNYKNEVRTLVAVNFLSKMIGLYDFNKSKKVEWISYRYISL